MMRCQLTFLMLWLLSVSLIAAPVTVGVEGRLEVSLPVAGLKTLPPTREANATVRIASSRTDGEMTLYDLRYIGLVPGRTDLRPFLLGPDGKPAAGLPPLDVEVAGLLPPGTGGDMIGIPQVGISAGGGYGWVMGGLVALWVLAGIPVFRRVRGPATTTGPVAPLPLTLPGRLRGMVRQAAEGKLDTAGKAELEQLILSHWSAELELQALPPAEVFARLRSHPQAGPLLEALEGWLHRRPGAQSADLSALVSAYGMPDEEPGKEAA